MYPVSMNEPIGPYSRANVNEHTDNSTVSSLTHERVQDAQETRANRQLRTAHVVGAHSCTAVSHQKQASTAIDPCCAALPPGPGPRPRLSGFIALGVATSIRLHAVTRRMVPRCMCTP